uniref:Uncharacterized protein n=1 Tax=Glossina pallidipes TaxID=7398 RepID=A0A1B0A4N9_GLOPL
MEQPEAHSSRDGKFESTLQKKNIRSFHKAKEGNDIDLLQKYSSFNKLISLTSLILTFTSLLFSNVKHYSAESFSVGVCANPRSQKETSCGNEWTTEPRM